MVPPFQLAFHMIRTNQFLETSGAAITVSSVDYGTITTYTYRGQPYDLATSRGGRFGSDMVLGQFLDA